PRKKFLQPENREVRMRAQKGLLGGLAGFAALAVLAGRLAAQPPAKEGIAAPKPGDARPAAVVNGEAIPMADVVSFLSQPPPPPTPLTDADKRLQQTQAVQFLVEHALMRQFLNKTV